MAEAGSMVRIILNSDVLYGDYSRDKLPAALTDLGEVCVERGDLLVFPTTTILEIDRRQREIVASRRKSLESAKQALTDEGILVPDFGLDDVIPSVRVRDLLSSQLSGAEFEEPSLSDFQQAHQRACLHESPHPPDIKTDEMRDLVIWAISIRIAKHDGGAVLVSRDAVHIHGRGDAEAAAASLIRVDSLDAALDYLEVKTPAGEQLEAMLAPSWHRLRDQGLPLGGSPVLLSVKNVQFVQGDGGPSTASGSISVRGEAGKIIAADVEIDSSNESDRTLRLSSVEIDGKHSTDINTVADYAPAKIQDDSETLSALRRLLMEE